MKLLFAVTFLYNQGFLSYVTHIRPTPTSSISPTRAGARRNAIAETVPFSHNDDTISSQVLSLETGGCNEKVNSCRVDLPQSNSSEK